MKRLTMIAHFRVALLSALILASISGCLERGECDVVNPDSPAGFAVRFPPDVLVADLAAVFNATGWTPTVATGSEALFERSVPVGVDLTVIVARDIRGGEHGVLVAFSGPRVFSDAQARSVLRPHVEPAVSALENATHERATVTIPYSGGTCAARTASMNHTTPG